MAPLHKWQTYVTVVAPGATGSDGGDRDDGDNAGNYAGSTDSGGASAGLACSCDR